MKQKRFIAMLLSTIMMLSLVSFQVSAADVPTADQLAVWVKDGSKLGDATILPDASGWNTSGSSLASVPQKLKVDLGEQSGTNGILDGVFQLSLVTSGAGITTSGAAIKKTGAGKETAPADNDYDKNTAIPLSKANQNATTYTADISQIADGDIIYVKMKNATAARYYAITVSCTPTTDPPSSIQTVIVGAQSGTIKAGTGGIATYSVNVQNIALNATTTSPALVINWTNGSAPTGVSTSYTYSTGTSGTITFTGTADAVAGSYPFKVTIEGTTSAQATLLVSPGDSVAKTVTVDSQTNDIVAGVGGTTSYSVSATSINLVSAVPSFTWTGDTPTGVTTDFIAYSTDTGTITVTVPPAVAEGSYPFTITIDGATSNVKTFVVLPANTKTLNVERDWSQGDIVANIGGSAKFNINTTNIANGTSVVTEWVTDMTGATGAQTPTGLTVTATKIASADNITGTATLTVNSTAAAIAGDYWLKVTVDGKSEVVNVNVAESFTLTYNANGATGGTVPAEPKYYQGWVYAPVLGNTGNLVRTDYVFKGWSEDPQATTPTDYTHGVPMNGNIILYAVWVDAAEAVYTLYTNDVLIDKEVVTINGNSSYFTAFSGNEYFDVYVEQMTGRTIDFSSNQTLGTKKTDVSYNGKRYTVIRVTYDGTDPYAYSTAAVDITVTNGSRDTNTYTINVTRLGATPLADAPFKLYNASNNATVTVSASSSAPRTYTASVANGVQSVRLEVDRGSYLYEIYIHKKVGTATNYVGMLGQGETEITLDSLAVGANDFFIELYGLSYDLKVTRASKSSSDSGSTGNTTGGGSGGGGGTSTTTTTTTTTTKPSPTNTASQNQAAVESLLDSGQAVAIALTEKNDTVTLNVATIDALINSNETLTITQGGTELKLTADMLKTLEATNGNVQISIAPLSNEVVAELVAAALASGSGDITLAAKVLDITLTVDGKEIKEFAQPLEISIDITASELAKGQIEKLSGVRLNNDGTISRLGGSYNEKTKKFNFFTSKLSMYSVIVAEDLVNLYMTLNSSAYTLNNAKRSLDVPPVIKDGRTLVPIRMIAESFGAKVDWDDATKTVTINLDGKSLKLTIGQRLSGMDVPPMIIDGRTMVPLRFISEYFGANVVYDDAVRSISIFR